MYYCSVSPNNCSVVTMILPSISALTSGGEPHFFTWHVFHTASANALPRSLTATPPVRIILTGSQRERPMLEEIAQATASPPLLLTDTTVGQLAALLRRARLVLGVDNGPVHLAVAQGTPTICI